LKKQNHIFILIFLSLTLFLTDCASKKQKKSGFDMQKELWETMDDTTEKKIYITDAKPVDSLDPRRFLYDVHRIKIDMYPDTIKLFSRVYDSSGNFVTELAHPYNKSDNKYFSSISEQLGKHYNIRNQDVPEFNVREYGAADSIPISTLIAIDYSGSMDHVMDVIHDGTEMFMENKFPYDNVGILTYNNKIDIKVPLDSNKARILGRWKNRKDRGFGTYTAVWDALDVALNQFEGYDKENPRIVVLFSDGDDNYSKTQVADLIEKAQKEDISVYTVAFGYSQDDNLKSISSQTGGKFYKAYTKEELAAIFKDIMFSLRFYYKITYQPPLYWGYHKAESVVSFPQREEPLYGYGEYDTGDMFDWSKLNSAFERPILFDFNKADIKDESIPIIDEIVDALMSKPTIRLEIQGHTDNIGTMEINQMLSERRAQAVLDMLVAKGIETRRLRYRGFGFTQPVAPNDTEENKAKNRRTVFVITAK